MLVYKARLGNSASEGTASATWIVRGRSFAEVAKKAAKTADKTAKEYVYAVWLVSLQYLGKEAS